MTLHGNVRRWIADEVDDAAAAELQALLDDGDDAELADRFGATLTFGRPGCGVRCEPGRTG